MRHLAILPALALAACGGQPMQSGPSPLLPSANSFDPIATPPATFDNPLAAAQYFARYDPGDEGASTMELLSQRFTGPNSLVMIFFVESYADDSVQGQQWRIELDRAGAGWRVTGAGKRVKCYRGATPGVWQQGLCP